MARKAKKPTEPRPCDSWVITTEIQVNGRHVVRGTELKISGERGRFVFIQHVVNGDASWIDVWGGPAKAEKLRSFGVERIQTVHYKKRTQTALAAQYKEKRKIQLAEQD